MGIDLKDHHVRGTHRKSPKSSNVYLELLCKLYSFLARRTDSKFNLFIEANTRDAQNLPHVSLPPTVQHTAKDEKNTVVIVGTITDDVRLLNVPKLDVAAV
ncbi:putative Ribosomal protein L18e/L15P domain-containing protein [Seiridium cardinale]